MVTDFPLNALISRKNLYGFETWRRKPKCKHWSTWRDPILSDIEFSAPNSYNLFGLGQVRSENEIYWKFRSSNDLWDIFLLNESFESKR